MTWPFWWTGTVPQTGTILTAWDYGVTWSVARTVDPTELPISPSDCLRALRDANADEESDLVEMWILAAAEAYERHTQKALMPQTLQMRLSGFPSSGQIRLLMPPLIEVVSLSYYDGDNASQELAVSPAEFVTVTSGRDAKAVLKAEHGGSFPSTYGRSDAVTVTYRAGHDSQTSQGFMTARAGIVLMVGELFKQRSLSVHDVHNTPSVLNLMQVWGAPVR